MNKSEMAKKLAAKAEISQAKAGEILDIVFSPEDGLVASELQAEQRVAIGGFGTFEVRERAARMGRNPRTGEQIKVRARKYPAFKAAKKLKDGID